LTNVSIFVLNLSILHIWPVSAIFKVYQCRPSCHNSMPYIIALSLLLCLSTPAAGQMTQPDSSFLQIARNQAVDSYERTLHEQAHVYEGNEYIAHDHRIKIHPFYRVDSLQNGTIIYNGVQYQNVQMLYDIVRDQLAIQPPGGGYRLRVRNDYIAAFTLGSHQFSRIVSNRATGDSATGVPTGFYEVLYDGNIKALSHRVKTIHEDISSGTYQADYVQKDRFYIQKAGLYHEVKSKRSMLNLFPDQAKALRKYIRTNKLKFNDDQREVAVTQVSKRYEELTR
jgi:hypothetical protein